MSTAQIIQNIIRNMACLELKTQNMFGTCLEFRHVLYKKTLRKTEKPVCELLPWYEEKIFLANST